MAFRLRRGTDLQRQAITPAEGELIYVTDTQEIYAGDGFTLGGVRITGSVEGSPAALTRDLDLDGYNISGTGTITATFIGDGSGLTNLNVDTGPGIIEGQEYQIDIRGDVRGFDSSTIIDSATNSVYANFIGDGSLITDLTLDQLDDVAVFSPGEGEVLKYISGFWTNAPESNSGTGIVDGQQYSISVQGDVVGLDSSLIVNATTREVTADAINSSSILSSGSLNVNSALGGSSQIDVTSIDDISVVKFLRTSETTISNVTQLGAMYFAKSDLGGDVTTGVITGNSNSILIGQNSAGVAFDSTNFLSWNGLNLGVGTFEGTTKIEIKEGSLRLNDTRTLESISTPLSGEIKYEAGDGSIYYSDGTDWHNVIATNVTTNRAVISGRVILDNTTAYTSIGTPDTGEFLLDGVTGDGEIYFYSGAQWVRLVGELMVADATILQSFLKLASKDTAARDGFGDDSSTIDGVIFYNTDIDRVEVFQAGSWVQLPNNGSEIGQVLTWNGSEWLGTNPATGGSVVSADQLDGFDGTYYLDFTNHTNTPTTLAGYGISDAATSSQGALADTALQPASLGSFTFTSSVLDTSDSSAITVTPAVSFSSDVTVENDLTVTNKITVDTLEVNTLITAPSAGTPEIASDGAILLTAGTRVEVTQSPFKMASFTSTARDLLSAEDGDMIYNSTTNKFQGYANGTWVDLH